MTNGPQLIHDESEISLRKAALLLVSVPDDEAAFLLSSLSTAQVARITKAIGELRSVLQIEQDVLAQELQQLPGDDSTASLDRQSTSTNHKTATTHPLTGHNLESANPRTVASVLRHELPQTAAATLCILPTRKAAEVLSLLPTHQQISVALRMVQMSDTEPATLQLLIENVLSAIQSREQSPRQFGGEAMMAQILSYADDATRKSMLVNLAAENRNLTRRLVRKISLFENRRNPVPRVDTVSDSTSGSDNPATGKPAVGKTNREAATSHAA